jgi:hypothetical protein
MYRDDHDEFLELSKLFGQLHLNAVFN